jgi:hypothetical protein
MENTAKPHENKEMPKDPKPSDEVQKHIETVIPESEKEVPTTGREQSKSEDPKEGEADKHTAPAENPEHKTEELGESQHHEDQAAPADNEGKESDDERDQVETVSP